MQQPKTIIARGNGITAMWFNGKVISAWDADGVLTSLHAGHALTAKGLGLLSRRFLLGLSGLSCPHGITPVRLCTKCGNTGEGELA